MGNTFPLLVTVKLGRNPKHDPFDKVTGPCPFTEHCTDSTGEHHTTIVNSQEELDHLQATYHTTRVEGTV